MSKSLLKVNNIEVVYNHVILALRGVTLDVEEGKVTLKNIELASQLKIINFLMFLHYS